ncbi:MAG: hypothetical protein EZS28_042977, partial [Streblomastix strix]
KEAELKKLNEKRIIAIINPDPDDIEFTDVDGTMKRISKKQTKHNTVSLTQVLEKGIWSLEAEFQNSQQGFTGVGGIEEIFFNKITNTAGNVQFTDNYVVRLEYDSFQGTLIFFVDGKQQPVYISGIKEKVRFIVYMYCAGQSCLIRSLNKLEAPTSGHVANEQAVQC